MSLSIRSLFYPSRDDLQEQITALEADINILKLRSVVIYYPHHGSYARGMDNNIVTQMILDHLKLKIKPPGTTYASLEPKQ